jgi:hypothetical protein
MREATKRVDKKNSSQKSVVFFQFHFLLFTFQFSIDKEGEETKDK